VHNRVKGIFHQLHILPILSWTSMVHYRYPRVFFLSCRALLPNPTPIKSRCRIWLIGEISNGTGPLQIWTLHVTKTVCYKL